MRSFESAIFFLACCCLTSGCALDTQILQRGGNGRTGVLLNYSCNAHPCDPIDPAKPTIVITHGWNPLPKRIHTVFADSSARAIRCRCGDSYNLLSWDWNAVKVRVLPNEPFRIGRCQGRMLAAALRARGVDPNRTQIISHSLGTIVAAQAAACLSDRGPVAQLTLLDPPKQFHEEIFCNLHATQHARCVENYWAPGLSGHGAAVDCRGVFNCRVDGPNPLWGVPDISMSNHVHTMYWYYDTIRCPSMQYGFQNSALRSYCRATPAIQQPTTVASTGEAGDELATEETLEVQFYSAAASDGSRKR